LRGVADGGCEVEGRRVEGFAEVGGNGHDGAEFDAVLVDVDLGCLEETNCLVVRDVDRREDVD